MKLLYALAIVVTGVPVIGAIVGVPANDLAWWVLLTTLVWVSVITVNVVASWATMLINNEAIVGGIKMVLVILGFYILVTAISSIITLVVPMIRFDGVFDPIGIGTLTTGVVAIMSVLTHFVLSALYLVLKWAWAPSSHLPKGVVKA